MMHYKDTIVTKAGQSVDVSTVQLPNGSYETCLFFPDGHSDVVDSYGDVGIARIGHQRWTSAGLIDEAWANYLNRASLY